MEHASGLEEKLLAVEECLKRRASPGPAVVYTATLKAGEAVVEALQARGWAASYHWPAIDRNEGSKVAPFTVDDNSVIVATTSYGMANLPPNTRCVVYFQLPGSLSIFASETAAAGSDGAPRSRSIS